jgi:hypothetical protein
VALGELDLEGLDAAAAVHRHPHRGARAGDQAEVEARPDRRLDRVDLRTRDPELEQQQPQRATAGRARWSERSGRAGPRRCAPRRRCRPARAGPRGCPAGRWWPSSSPAAGPDHRGLRRAELQHRAALAPHEHVGVDQREQGQQQHRPVADLALVRVQRTRRGARSSPWTRRLTRRLAGACARGEAVSVASLATRRPFPPLAGPAGLRRFPSLRTQAPLSDRRAHGQVSPVFHSLAARS